MWIEGLFHKNARGPVFYREKRISRGKPFSLFKFRVLTAAALQKTATENSVWFLQFEKENTTVVTNGFRKKAQKLPEKEKGLALKRMKSYNFRVTNGDYYEE